eukprot:3638909-Amphidinium_carterae.1
MARLTCTSVACVCVQLRKREAKPRIFAALLFLPSSWSAHDFCWCLYGAHALMFVVLLNSTGGIPRAPYKRSCQRIRWKATWSHLSFIIPSE